RARATKSTSVRTRASSVKSRVLIVAGFVAAAAAPIGPVKYVASAVTALTLIVEFLWIGRAHRAEVLELSLRQLWDLIEAVPELYAEQLLTKTPEAAA